MAVVLGTCVRAGTVNEQKTLPSWSLGTVRKMNLKINTRACVLSLRSAGGYEISPRWRAGMQGVILK